MTDRKIVKSALLLALWLAGAAGWSQTGSDSEGASISLHLTPGIDLPLSESSSLFNLGGSMSLSGEYSFGKGSPLFLIAAAGYGLNPDKANVLMHTLSGGVGAGVSLPVLPRLSLKAYLSGGYYYSFLDDLGQLKSGGNPYASGGLGVSFLLSPLLDAGASVSYHNLFGLYQGIQVYLGTSLFLSGTAGRETRMRDLPARPDLLRAKTPDADRGIAVNQVEFETVFPVFRNYYDEHPIGRAVFVSQEKAPITGIRATFFIKKYMDSPKELEVPARLEPGQRAAIDFYALLTSAVMDITESDKASAEISLEYRVGDDRYADTKARTIRFYNRNAMSWDDDSKAAAFVTRYDPLIMQYTRNVTSALEGMGNEAVGKKLLAAVGIHHALLLDRIAYAVDPKSSYADLSSREGEIDYLQFPRQTLQNRGGDCDDLSILYCALLEAMGIDTAFVTVPGHIFMAFSLGIPQTEVARTFSSLSDFIDREGEMWVPIEVTERTGGFSEAWLIGSRQFKQYSASGKIGFIPLKKGWQKYPPVQSPDSRADGAAALTLPAASSVSKSVKAEIQAIMERELAPRLAQLRSQLDPKGVNPAVQNRIGVLYARYGLTDKAAAEFGRLVADERKAYTPALVNLGNIHLMKGNIPKALELYRAAALKEPGNAAAQIGVARASFALKDFDLSRRAYVLAQQNDPKLAGRYSYLQGEGESGTRASDAAAAGGELAWDEQ